MAKERGKEWEEYDNAVRWMTITFAIAVVVTVVFMYIAPILAFFMQNGISKKSVEIAGLFLKKSFADFGFLWDWYLKWFKKVYRYSGEFKISLWPPILPLISFPLVLIIGGRCFIRNRSTEWQEEFAQVVDELNRESADEQHSFYQESQTVSPYTDGINLDAYYRIFGLTPETLTAESLKKAYRSLCLQYHPDRNKQPDAAVKFDKVQRVYETLQRELAHKNA
mgnify:CR=1 FL=1